MFFFIKRSDMLIWRLEGSHGNGPWTDSNNIYRIDRILYRRYKHHDYSPDHHPGPKDKMKKFMYAGLSPDYRKNIIFGCNSFEQFKVWFSPPFMKLFIRCNPEFKIKVYKVHKNCTKSDDLQVAFKRDKSEVVKIFDVKEYFSLDETQVK